MSTKLEKAIELQIPIFDGDEYLDKLLTLSEEEFKQWEEGHMRDYYENP